MATNEKCCMRFMHYHAVDTSIYFDTVRIIRRLLRARLSAGRETFTFSIDNLDWDTLYVFLEQMETLYEHPRSVSKRWRAFFKEPSEYNATIISDEIQRGKSRPKKQNRPFSANQRNDKNLS